MADHLSRAFVQQVGTHSFDGLQWEKVSVGSDFVWRARMRIGVTGGTGFIGARLCRKLLETGNDLVLFGRDREKANTVLPGAEFVKWCASTGAAKNSTLTGFDAFVHLAGEPIAGGRWTSRRKRVISESRIQGTRDLVEAFRRCGDPPKVVISSSAIGYYGNRKGEELDESSAPGSGFLPDLCVRWEEEASRFAELGSRLVLLRTGVVLSSRGGALAKMLLPFKLGLGGSFADGKQFMSWIHDDDQISLIDFALSEKSLEGPLNATAPVPVTNADFARKLGQVLSRPSWLPVPRFVLRLALGEMAEALLLEGQRVFPRKAMKAGFRFRFRELSEALTDLFPGTHEVT